jgi:hypothetical protein
MDVTFEKDAVDHVLASFDKTVDENGYVVDGDTGERVQTPSGEELEAEELAIVAHGSELFIDDNFASLVEHVERQR